MKKIILILIFTSLFVNVCFAQTIDNKLSNLEKSQYKRLYKINKILYPGDSSINISYYWLNLTLTYNPNYLKGIVTVNAASTTDGLSGFFLDLQDPLKVDSVILNGQKIFFTHSSAKLNISLPGIYNKGDSFSVKIYYEGIPGSSGFGSFEFGSHNGLPAIWSLSEPYGASDWWPCKDTPADKADSSDVWITCDNSLIAASNGTLISTVDNGDGTHTFKWKNTYPIAQYLISVAIANYTKYTTYYYYTSSDSMPIENFIYPEDFNNAKPYLDKVANMISIFSSRYGPYPFLKEKYGQAEFGWGGGMEHQTITSLGGFDEDLEAHELSHQWYGDKITCADWQDIWLNEGFASFSEAVYFEATSGESGYNSIMSKFISDAKNAYGPIYVRDISSIDSIFNYIRSYAKGATVLYMLRGIMGDSLFFKLMKYYSADSNIAYGAATTLNLETDAGKILGTDLSYFFNEWIYGENYPHYSVKWNYNSLGNNMYSVNLNISQTINTNPSFFTMPIQIEISTSVGDTIITVFNDAQSQQLNLVVKGTPIYLNFDPNNLILKEISIIDSIDITKPTSFQLFQNYPNPFNPNTIITYSIPIDAKGYVHVKLTVYDAIGKVVAILADENETAGTYKVRFPSGSQNYSSGIYYYNLQSGNFSQTKKMIDIK